MARLRQKDKRAVLILLIALVLFAFVQFAVSPLLAERKQLERKIRSKENGLTEMQTMQNEIKMLSRQNNSFEQLLAARPADFNLFAFLEEKCAETQVKDNISYMKPTNATGDGAVQQLMVKMKLKAIRLNLLVAFLERVESAKNIVALNYIKVDVNEKDHGTLDVTMHVITLVQSELIGD
ncbi:MAG: hypothetical protein WGN25_09530 [Candidatus Electrothrix sp. GW3-4]|uniref:hypothetical protein n=1 Tax=Candidatus Electrothrix sp. GW3-4 TaxID=3126740 RepID=UPI0030CD6F08